MRIDHRVARLAARQHSVVTRRQLLQLGLTERQIDYRIETGVLVVCHPGTYLIPGSQRTHEQAVMAACLASGGVASGRCAAGLFRLRGCRQRLVEITVEGSRAPRLDGVVTHRTQNLLRTTIGVVPVTMPAQIAVDLAALAPHLLGAAVADLLVRVTTLRSIVQVAQAAGGRRGVALLRKEVEEYLAGKRPTESALEDAFLGLLRRHGIPEPERQFEPPWDPRRRVDFARRQDRLLIELDGRVWHSSAADRERDRKKDERAAEAGWRTVRITWVDVHDAPGQVIEWLEIKRAA
jgi:hypothetical protein